jgi:PilZ domain
MSLFRSLFTRIGIAERRKEQRMDAQGLTVSCAAGTEQSKAQIGNISPTGLYLATEKRWQPGAAVLLTLEEKRTLESSCRSRVKLWTRCARVDENGAGLTFAQAHMDQAKWVEAMSNAPSLIAENHPVHVFRLTRALAFLAFISPDSETRIRKLMTENLTRERTERVIEIVLLAEELLESENCPIRTDVSPELIVRALELAIEVEEAEVRDCWARMLAASISTGAEDVLNLTYLTLLSKLGRWHLRILSAAWDRAVQADHKTRGSASDEVFCSVEEIEAIAGAARVERIEWMVNDLHELGILGGSLKPALGGRLFEVNLTLSELGRGLCARCFGQPARAEEESRSIGFHERKVDQDSEYVPAGRA